MSKRSFAPAVCVAFLGFVAAEIASADELRPLDARQIDGVLDLRMFAAPTAEGSAQLTVTTFDPRQSDAQIRVLSAPDLAGLALEDSFMTNYRGQWLQSGPAEGASPNGDFWAAVEPWRDGVPASAHPQPEDFVVFSAPASIAQLARSWPSEPPSMLTDFSRLSGAFAVVPGGYATSFAPPTPLGEVKTSGLRLSEAHESWLVDGRFCSAGRSYAILDADDGMGEGRYPDCVQAGPLIVVDGANRFADVAGLDAELRDFAASRQEHSFACVDANGALALGYTEPMTLGELGDALTSPQLRCRAAIRLSGHDTAGLVAAGAAFGNDELPLHNVIAVVPSFGDDHIVRNDFLQTPEMRED